MIDELFAILLTLIVLGIGFVLQPTRARCPTGDFVNGVRPDGSTWCIRDLEHDLDCSGAKRCIDTEPLRYTTPLKIYCTNGQQAIAIDGRTIGCQARH